MRVRLCCAIAAICLMSTALSAQTGLRSASLPERTPTGIPPPPPTLPSASLPDRTPAQPIPPSRGDLFLARPDTYAPFDDAWRRGHHRPGYPLGYAYGYPPYVAASPDSRDRDRVDALTTGYLHLQMQPGNAQVYVDGFYMGSVDDFRRLIPGRSLTSGAHRVELRASGYETTAFDVMIAPHETVTYRTDLEPAGGSVKAMAAVPGKPRTFYVIPGCYAGDTPPRARLPRGCDRSKLRAVPPQTVLSVKR